MVEISVIIPTYNCGRFIAQAIDSVLAQTFQDFEIIVVDDGSNDDTRKIINRYGEKVKYLYQQQTGVSCARNRGINASTGRFIAFLDADDLWLPTKLEKQMELFHSAENIGMVFTENCLFDSQGVFKKKTGKRRLMNGNLARNIFLLSGVVTPTVMVKKNILDEIGGFEESLMCAEDDNLWIRIAALYKVRLIDEPLAKIRDHESRLTKEKSLIIQSIFQNIEFLCSKYGDEVKNVIEPVVAKKKASLYFDMGYEYFERGNLAKAKKEFRNAWKNNKYNIHIILYLFFSLLPPHILRCLLWFKTRMLIIRLFEGGRWTRK